MKIDKITFKNNQALVVIRDNSGLYLGTWHVVDSNFVEYIRKINPEEMYFDKSSINLEVDKMVDELYGGKNEWNNGKKNSLQR